MSSFKHFNLAQKFVGDCTIITDTWIEIKPPRSLGKVLDYCLNELFQKLARDINPKRWVLPELSIKLTDCGRHLQELRAEFKLPNHTIPFFVLKEVYEDDLFVTICFEQKNNGDQEILYKGMLGLAYRKAFHRGNS